MRQASRRFEIHEMATVQRDPSWPVGGSLVLMDGQDDDDGDEARDGDDEAEDFDKPVVGAENREGTPIAVSMSILGRVCQIGQAGIGR